MKDNSVSETFVDEVSVLLIEDQSLFAELAASFLSKDGPFRVSIAHQKSDGLEAIALQGGFDVVLVNVNLPDRLSLTEISEIVVANSFGKVALLSDDLGRDFVYESLELGVMGFIPKTLSLQALGHAIKLVSSGVPFIPVDFFKTSKQSDQINNFGLTPNEFDVLRKLAMGYSNKEIMAALDISDSAIKMRVRSLTRKLGARNRTHAVILAREARLLD